MDHFLDESDGDVKDDPADDVVAKSIDQDEHAAGTENAVELADDGGLVGVMVKRVAAGDDIHRRIVEGEMFGVVVDRVEAIFRGGLGDFVAKAADHFLGIVEAGELVGVGVGGEGHQEVARAAADVEQAIGPGAAILLPADDLLLTGADAGVEDQLAETRAVVRLCPAVEVRTRGALDFRVSERRGRFGCACLRHRPLIPCGLRVRLCQQYSTSATGAGGVCAQLLIERFGKAGQWRAGGSYYRDA